MRWSCGLVVLWSCGLAVLAGCTLAPKYQRPAAAISPAWPAAPAETGSQTSAIPAANIGWRDFFRDPRLQRLIELALTNNPDLRVAMLNVDQTRALYRVQRAALVPTVNVNANGTRQRTAFGFAGNGNGTTYSQFNVNLGVAQYGWTFSARFAASNGRLWKPISPPRRRGRAPRSRSWPKWARPI